MATEIGKTDQAQPKSPDNGPDSGALSRRNILRGGTTLALASALGSATPNRTVQAQQAPPIQIQPGGRRPNILVIFGDDIGATNISAYAHGVVGYKTPNIDRIAREGMMFIDYYAENSCTAGRSTFITGQSPLRTGLSKVGIPGATVGLQARDITIAQALKPLGYATGQFGKNHLGDRNEYLPTVHGFDEFFGNLYHLNAEEEPERPYYPKDKNDPFVRNFSPRGVIRSWATDADDTTEQPHWGRVGRQRIQDTGPLNRKRMETIDDETSRAAVDFMQRQAKAGTPFFLWFNSTRMHLFTHIRAAYQGQSGMPGNAYADGMIEHDGHVGLLLRTLDDLGIANDTIVVYSTDNGPNMFSWPDAAMTPFRSEKDTNWEGAFRVPGMVRWPGKIKAGEVSTQMFSGLDWFPTLLAAAGDTGIKERLLKGWSPRAGGTEFKVHLDGYNQLPFLTGQQPRSARSEFHYFNDDGEYVAMRYDDWKVVFCEQRARGNLNIWQEPFTCLRVPKLFNLRMDPYERADITSDQYNDWLVKNVYLVQRGVMKGSAFLETFVAYPPSQEPASFSIDQVRRSVDQRIAAMKQRMQTQGGGAGSRALQ